MMTCTCASPRHGWPLPRMEGMMTWTGDVTTGEQSCCWQHLVISCSTDKLESMGFALGYRMLCGQAAPLDEGQAGPSCCVYILQPAPRW